MTRAAPLLVLCCGGCPDGQAPLTEVCAIGDRREPIGADEVSVYGQTPREMVQMPLGVRTPAWDEDLAALGETLELGAQWSLDQAAWVRFEDERCEDFVEVVGRLTIDLPRFAAVETSIRATLDANGRVQHAVRDDLAPLPGEDSELLALLPDEGEFVRFSWTVIYDRVDEARPVVTVTGSTRQEDGLIEVTPIAAGTL